MGNRSSKCNPVNFDVDLENWMTTLPEKLKLMPLTYLAIPGSHDSMTSSITMHSKLAPDAEEVLQRLKFLGPLLPFIMSRWSKTQSLSIMEQLRSGIRYFDLRLAIKQNQVYPYFVHGLYATEVVPALKSLRNFLDKHPYEVVILDFQHFYAFQKLDHENFVRLLYAIFKKKMLPYFEQMEYITLKYMTIQFQYQIIIIYRYDPIRFQQEYLWPSSGFPTPWPQTVSKTELFAKLDEGIRNRSHSRGYVSQCVLTPTNWFVTKHLFSTLKKQCAVPLEKKKQEWLNLQKAGPEGVNIIISDFVEMEDNRFMKEVIRLNYNI